MKRIKSAPANIALMVNRKKAPQINIEDNKSKSIPIHIPISMQSMKNSINVEKIFNNIMIDYIDDKKIISNSDEESFLMSILYFYICEKMFSKNNLRELGLFIIQMLVKYILLHHIDIDSFFHYTTIIEPEPECKMIE